MMAVLGFVFVLIWGVQVDKWDSLLRPMDFASTVMPYAIIFHALI